MGYANRGSINRGEVNQTIKTKGNATMTEKKEKRVKASSELKDFLKERRNTPELQIIEKDIAVFQSSRSEWGDSSGIGYFDQIHVYFHGQTKMKEWQWRDRWSASNDRHDLRIFGIGKVSVSDANHSLKKISVELINEEYSNRETIFTFDPKNNVHPSKISKKEQRNFENLLKKEKAKIMSRLNELWECKPKMLVDYSGYPIIPQGSPAYTHYKKPSIKDEKTFSELGIAAFITEEQIDNRGTDPQYRYELYVLKHDDKETKKIGEDHAYEKREGSASMAIIELKQEMIIINTRVGKKTITI